MHCKKLRELPILKIGHFSKRIKSKNTRHGRERENGLSHFRSGKKNFSRSRFSRSEKNELSRSRFFPFRSRFPVQAYYRLKVAEIAKFFRDIFSCELAPQG